MTEDAYRLAAHVKKAERRNIFSKAFQADELNCFFPRVPSPQLAWIKPVINCRRLRVPVKAGREKISYNCSLAMSSFSHPFSRSKNTGEFTTLDRFLEGNGNHEKIVGNTATWCNRFPFEGSDQADRILMAWEKTRKLCQRAVFKPKRSDVLFAEISDDVPRLQWLVPFGNMIQNFRFPENAEPRLKSSTGGGLTSHPGWFRWLKC